MKLVFLLGVLVFLCQLTVEETAENGHDVCLIGGRDSRTRIVENGR